MGLAVLFGLSLSEGQSQVAYTYDWEPTGLVWSSGGTSGSFSRTTTNPCSGTGSARANVYYGGNSTLTSPLLGTSNGGTVSFDFNYKVVLYSSTTTGATASTQFTIEVQYATSTSGPWTTALLIDNTNHTTSGTCATKTATFDPPAGDLYVRFKMNSIGGSTDLYSYFDDINITQGAPPSCPKPTALNVTNVTSNSADFGWTSSSSEWEVVYGSPGFTPMPSGITTMSNPQTSGTLASSTNYQFYVRNICAPGDTSTWAGPFSFTTQCSPITTFPYVEDFETGGSGWTFGGTTPSWQIGTPSNTVISSAANGTGAAVTNLTGSYVANELSYLYTPCFNFSGFNYPIMAFNFIRDFENCCDEGWVEYTTDGSTWTKLGTSTSWISNGYNDASNQWWDSDNTTWTLTAHQLTALVGQAYVQFRFVMSADVSTQNEGMGIDDFTIYNIACPDPTNLATTWVDNDSVIVTWSAGYLESDWNVELGLAGFTPGTGAEIYAGTASTVATDTIGNLDQITDYDVYVQADCGGGDFSEWIGPVSFTTLPNCSAPTGLMGTVLSPDSVALAWTGGSTGETEWTVQYGVSGFTLGNGMTTSVLTTPMDTIGLLTQNTTYDFYVLGNCSLTDSSLWVGPISLTTELYCNNPGGLSASVNQDTAFLSWVAGSNGETMWNVEYGPLGFTLGSGTMYTTSDNNPDTLSGLFLSASYEFYVQAACASGDTSLFVGPYSFSTPLGNDDPCDAIELPVDGVSRSFTSSGATTATGEPQNGSGGASTWFYFTPVNDFGTTVSLCGSGFDTKVYGFLYDDCNDFNTFTELNYNDDYCGLSSEIEVCGSAGVPVLVKVDGFSGASGNFLITISSNTFEAGTGSQISACLGDTVNLWSQLSGSSDLTGTWVYANNQMAIYHDTLAVTGNMTSLSNEYYYLVGNSCASDTATVTINAVAPGNTGTAITPFTACNSDVFLPDGLTGVVEQGGTWSDDSNTGLLVGPNGNVFAATGLPVGTYPFTYTIDNGICPAASTTVTVTLANCTEVEENNVNLSLYPNPNNGNFFITSDKSEESTIVITDIRGAVIYNVNTTLNASNPFEVNLSNVEAGMYMINVSSASGSKVMTIVIQ